MDIRSHQTIRVLRVGVVVKGRALDEQNFKPGSEVTIGSAPDCTFTMHAPFEKHTLLVYGHAESFVNMLSGMTYKMALEEVGLVDGEVPETEATKNLKITLQSRGRVTVGDVSFLFSFTDKPVLSKSPRDPRTLLERIRSMFPRLGA